MTSTHKQIVKTLKYTFFKKKNRYVILFLKTALILIGQNRYCGMCKIHIYTWFSLIINEKWIPQVQPLWVKWKIWLQYLSFFCPENVWLWYILRTFFCCFTFLFPWQKCIFRPQNSMNFFKELLNHVLWPYVNEIKSL